MVIPNFDGILNVLPPHLGNPAVISHLSPYPCTIDELCDRFATSQNRKNILEGFLNLRRELFNLGIQGFQWLDGSFLEDIETQEGRDPKDIDVVTFVTNPCKPQELENLLRKLDNRLVEDNSIPTASTVAESESDDVPSPQQTEIRLNKNKPSLHDQIKSTYFVDHFWLPLGSEPVNIVHLARYWYGLFSHRRDGLWKGMLTIDLLDPDDAMARTILGGKP